MLSVKHVQNHLELCSKTCRARLLLLPLGHWYVYIMIAYTTRGGHATLVDIGKKNNIAIKNQWYDDIGVTQKKT